LGRRKGPRKKRRDWILGVLLGQNGCICRF
jgi:hypothetical protein